MKPRRSFGRTPRPIGTLGENKSGQKENGSGNGLEADLEANLRAISSLLGNPSDLAVRRLALHGEPQPDIAVVYLASVVQSQEVSLTVIEPLLSLSHVSHEAQGEVAGPLEVLRLSLPTIHSIYEARSLKDLTAALLEGNVAILVDGEPAALYFDAVRPPTRLYQVPTSETTVIGPQIGLVESVDDNLALIRARIRHPRLRVEKHVIGRKSKTDVRLVYIEGVAPREVVDELRRRLSEIDTDLILDTGMLRDLIADRPYSPFVMERMTERPDTVAAEINLGRIAILVEGSPFAMLVPSQFFTLIESAEDYYLNPLSASVLKVLRMFAYMLSVLATPLYVAIVNFHFELVPLPLLLNIAATQEGVPFPLPFAAFITEVVLDIVREAGIRLPRQFGPVVSIFGAVILGQSAVQAGFVPPGLIIVAMMGTICSFAVPRAEKALAYRLIRFPLLLLGSILGFPGITIGAVAFVYHVASLKTLGIPYAALYAPGQTTRLSRKMVKVSARHQPITRPLAQADRVRQGEVPEPRDPKAND